VRQNSIFRLIYDEKSKCDLEHGLSLLVRDDGRGDKFYICFECRKVFEVGVGRVRNAGEKKC
jgi:hypothetical protein